MASRTERLLAGCIPYSSHWLVKWSTTGLNFIKSQQVRTGLSQRLPDPAGRAAHFSRSELTRHGVRCGRTGMACGVDEPAWRAVRMNRHGPKVAACGMQRAPIVQTDP